LPAQCRSFAAREIAVSVGCPWVMDGEVFDGPDNVPLRIETGPEFTYICAHDGAGHPRDDRRAHRGRARGAGNRGAGGGHAGPPRAGRRRRHRLRLELRGIGLTDTLIDLYVLTDTGEAVSRNRLARLGCRLVPPNVHYGEARHGAVALRAKYAVLPLDQFARRMGQGVANPYFWARFAQPCRIVWVRDEDVRRKLVAALAQAVRTMIAASLPLGRPGDDALDLWRRGLAETYRTELRPESGDRARGIVAANAPYYRAVTEAVLGPAGLQAKRAAGRLGAPAGCRQGPVGAAAAQGGVHLRGRGRLRRLEDRPPFGGGDRGQALAAPPPGPRRPVAAPRPPAPRRAAIATRFALVRGVAATTLPKRSRIWSISSAVWAAETEQRSRHRRLGVPGGTAMLT
jgi:hypothetical protein